LLHANKRESPYLSLPSIINYENEKIMEAGLGKPEDRKICTSGRRRSLAKIPKQKFLSRMRVSGAIDSAHGG